MFLLIAEVSQKQAYIFKSLRLKDNIANSEAIERVLQKEFFEKLDCGYTDENMVYSGGGHSVLQFNSQEEAKNFALALTKKARNTYSKMEIFVYIMEYDESKTPVENMVKLSEGLEYKKSIRSAAFKKGSFGIESAREGKKAVDNSEDEYKGYRLVKAFDELGGSRNESNFIAVIHIDGNSMGERVVKMREKYNTSWDDFKKISQEFSRAIDKDFKSAYSEMVDIVIENIKKGNLEELKIKGKNLPVRKLILAGDDVCFVTEGRIGLECARIFIERLTKKKNSVDGNGYSACAGVSIVHLKFPFYRAYEMAEGLCSNAKRVFAKENGKISAIDWHIDFGELDSSVSSVKNGFIADDGTNMLLRPYIVDNADASIWNYSNFKKLCLQMKALKNNEDKNNDPIARGKVKELRNVLRDGEKPALKFIESNRISSLKIDPINDTFKKIRIEDILFGNKNLDSSIYVDTYNREHKEDNGDKSYRCSILFDAIECMDTFVPLEGGENNEINS